MDLDPFNPLDKRNLGLSIANAIIDQDPLPLGDLKAFFGAGIYALYYKGDFELYQKIREKNEVAFTCPIYVGKAVPEGARKGGLGLEVPKDRYLFRRLIEHKKSIESAKNLRIEDFFYRFLSVDEIWIPLGESLLIERTKPLWNMVLDGFGNHDPGSGRYNQQISPWDTLHPGRSWALKLKQGKSLEEIKSSIRDFST